MRKNLTYATVAFVSFATILFELLQTRILSFIFWNHMVYLTVSIALLGFGISGTLVAIFASKVNNRELLISRLVCGFGCSVILALSATKLLPWFGFHTSMIKILYCYLVYLLPFVFAGAILSLIFSWQQFSVARLYAVDLLCAGLACVLFFFLLPVLEPSRLIGSIALCMGLLSWLWIRPAQKMQWLSPSIIALTGLLLILLGNNTRIALYPEDYKELFGYLHCKNSAIEKTIWTPLCRLDVVGNGKDKVITQDGTAHTFLYSAQAIKDMWTSIRQHSDTEAGSVVFELKDSPNVAVIGVGGGYDVIAALGYGAKFVLGAELNPFTYDLITRDYAEFNGHIFAKPNVKIRNEEGRSMLRQEDRRFDIIQIHAIDTFAAITGGAYVLSENYLYTVEAFKDMFAHLQPDGILSFFRWVSMPPKESLRLAALGCEAWKRNGCKTIPEQLYVLMTPDGWAVELFKNSPFTQIEIDTVAHAALQRHLDILYYPKIGIGNAEKLGSKLFYPPTSKIAQECSRPFNELISAYATGTEKKFFDDYPFLVKPSTDDSPFFFEYYAKNPFSLPNFNELRGSAARVTLYIVMLEATFFTVVAIFWPLWKFSKTGLAVPHAKSWSLYFTAIGIGFMLIEIGLMQKSVLFLGSSLYSLPVILASILLSAGCGSWLVSTTNWEPRQSISILGSLLLINIIAIAAFLTPVFYSLFHLPLIVRIIINGLVIFPAGLLMGTFMPIALRYVKAQSPEYLPWAWGINGCSSVYGSFLAILLAISFGFTVSLLAGAVVYLIAIISALGFAKRSAGTAIPTLPNN